MSIDFLEADEESQDSVPEDQPESEDIVVEDDDEADLEYRPVEKVEKIFKDKDGQAKDKKTGNPFAALRVANRENKILSDRLERVLQLLEQSKEEQEPEPEPEPDYADNPLGAVNYKVNKLLKENEELKKASKEKTELEAVKEVVTVADNGIKDFRDKVGNEDYDAAIQHLVSLRISDLAEAYPEATQDEIGRFILNEAQQEKVKLARAGKNPGKVFYEYAVRHGYKPKERAVDPPKSKESPRDIISRQKERDAKTKTIAAVPGKAPKTPSIDDFVGMSEDDFEDYMVALSKQKGRKGSTLKVNEILASAR